MKYCTSLVQMPLRCVVARSICALLVMIVRDVIRRAFCALIVRCAQRACALICLDVLVCLTRSCALVARPPLRINSPL